MFKSGIHIFALIFIFTLSALAGEKILDHIGNWRVTVGPAGNEFYQPPFDASNTAPPSKKVMQVVKEIVPDYIPVSEWEPYRQNIYLIRADKNNQEYSLAISNTGRMLQLEYSDDARNLDERPDRLILKGTRHNIPLSNIPGKTMNILKQISPDTLPSQAWIGDTPVGLRYVLKAGQMVYYATPTGAIHAAGLISRGALNEIDPNKQKTEKSKTEILAECKNLLSSYRDRFNLQKNLKKLGNTPKSSDGHFRFVVLGDNRSNSDLWSTIIEHINTLEPKPAFVINTGDIVRHGYAKEYHDYYIPPLLKTDIPYFVAIGNHDDGDSGLATEYQYLFGENSLNYYFDYGKIRFILMDDVTKVQPFQKTLRWLEEALKTTPEGYKIIVNTHQPSSMIKKWAYHSWDDQHSKIFSDLMTKYHVSQVFDGHIHAYSTATYHGVPYTITGGGGAGLHDRFGPQGNVHNYVICDAQPDGTVKQTVVRFFEEKKK